MGKSIKNQEKKEIINLTGRELQTILRHWGFSQAEFCRFIGYHKNYFTRKFLERRGPIPQKFVSQLKEFLGDEDFTLAINLIEDLREQMK